LSVKPHRPVLDTNGLLQSSITMRSPGRLTRALDALTRRVQLELSMRQRVGLFVAVYALYAGAILITTPYIGVSSNYLVFLPLLTAAAVFGWNGGVFFGIAALPSNMLLYALIGRLQDAPQDPLIAWITGIFTGIVLGYFSDFYRRLQFATEENRFLVEELHHRVKNNLGIISGLIQYHCCDIDDPAALKELTQLKHRVHSIAAVHDRLHRNRSDTRAGIECFADLVVQIGRSLIADPARVTLSVDTSRARTPIDEEILTCIGMITNEFITNSVEHAFPDGQGTISVSLESDASQILFRISDTGTGLPEGFDVDALQTLGFSLMRSLAARAGGELEIDGRSGTAIQLRIPRCHD
jgi:two-component sensor histidine kinase